MTQKTLENKYEGATSHFPCGLLFSHCTVIENCRSILQCCLKVPSNGFAHVCNISVKVELFTHGRWMVPLIQNRITKNFHESRKRVHLTQLWTNLYQFMTIELIEQQIASQGSICADCFKRFLYTL